MLPQTARPLPALLALLLAASLPAAQEEGPAVHDLAPHAGAARLALSPPGPPPDTRTQAAPRPPPQGRARQGGPCPPPRPAGPGARPGGDGLRDRPRLVPGRRPRRRPLLRRPRQVVARPGRGEVLVVAAGLRPAPGRRR